LKDKDLGRVCRKSSKPQDIKQYVVEKLPTYSKNIKQMPDGSWRVRFKLGNKEKKKTFGKEEEAKEYLKEAKSGIIKMGHRWGFLTDGQRSRIMVVLEDLSEGKGDTHAVMMLEKAGKLFKETKAKEAGCTVSYAVEALIDHWKQAKMNGKYVSNAGGLLRRFASAHPKPIKMLKPSEARAWWNSLGKNKKTGKARLSALLTFAEENEWAENFVKGKMVLERSTPEPPEIPTFAEIKAELDFLVGSEKYRPLLRPYMLRLLAGPRTKESLDPRVREEEGMLLVPTGAAAKRGPARLFKVPEYLAWKKWCDEKKLPILSTGQFNKLDGEYRAERGMTHQKKWHNWQRHTYASYMISKLKGNAKKLAAQMGNSPQVLKNHYLGKVLAKDAHKLWTLTPPVD
jgi:hypothetical protein